MSFSQVPSDGKEIAAQLNQDLDELMGRIEALRRAAKDPSASMRSSSMFSTGQVSDQILKEVNVIIKEELQALSKSLSNYKANQELFSEDAVSILDKKIKTTYDLLKTTSDFLKLKFPDPKAPLYPIKPEAISRMDLILATVGSAINESSYLPPTPKK